MIDPKKLDLSRLTVYPLENRQHLSHINDIIIDPDDALLPISESQLKQILRLEKKLRRARDRGASAVLIYGAHLIKNVLLLILVNQLIESGWITHIATNGAGSIHDWEFAHIGASTESVEKGVKNGSFGAWDETAKNIHIAILSGAIDSLGYGQSLGRFINENGYSTAGIELVEAIKNDPTSHLTSARADLWFAINQFSLKAGKYDVSHPYRETSIIASAWRHKASLRHPSIGYDIIANHPIFSGSAIGRAGEWDFKLFGGGLENLNGGITISVGSAIMGPQVFEKAMSCVNNRRIIRGTAITDHSIYVVDIQDGVSNGIGNMESLQPTTLHTTFVSVKVILEWEEQ